MSCLEILISSYQGGNKNLFLSVSVYGLSYFFDSSFYVLNVCIDV